MVNIISHVYTTSPSPTSPKPPAFSFTLLCCSDCPHGLRSCSTKHLGETYKCWLVEIEQHRSLTHVYRFLIISHVLKENLYPRSACFIWFQPSFFLSYRDPFTRGVTICSATQQTTPILGFITRLQCTVHRTH